MVDNDDNSSGSQVILCSILVAKFSVGESWQFMRPFSRFWFVLAVSTLVGPIGIMFKFTFSEVRPGKNDRSVIIIKRHGNENALLLINQLPIDWRIFLGKIWQSQNVLRFLSFLIINEYISMKNCSKNHENKTRTSKVSVHSTKSCKGNDDASFAINLNFLVILTK